ncbi:MAG: extracellular solute-binding protein [Ruminococcaceae bacterium]|nr:extracellular solute-binding protein [Oscillospiraceae bacterium]
MKSKILALFLAVLMFLPSFVGCSDVSENTESETDPVESDLQKEKEETESNYELLEKQNLGGYTFNCFGGAMSAEDIDTVGNVEFIYVDDYTGDDFFDKMYARYLNVGSAFNVKFNITGSVNDDLLDTIKRSVTAGTHDYSAVYTYVDSSSTFIDANYFYNIYNLNINLEDPWWDKGAKDNLTVNNRMYLLFSAISFSHYESGAVLFYNGQILENKNIRTSPYELWKEGKWTIDALQSMTEKTATDYNNDGKYRKGIDIIGLAGHTLRYATLVFASGYNFIKWDNEKNYYRLNFTDEKVMKIGDATRLLWNESPWNNNNTVGDPAHPIFKAGKLTFLSEYLGQFRKLRDNDDPYSIILWPTIEENMNAKVHLRNPTGIAILTDNSSKDIETISTILNALATYSYDYILEDYIKYAVVAKSSRDEESAEVVRYALSNTAYDISAALGLGAHHWWNEACQENTYASTERAHMY